MYNIHIFPLSPTSSCWWPVDAGRFLSRKESQITRRHFQQFRIFSTGENPRHLSPTIEFCANTMTEPFKTYKTASVPGKPGQMRSLYMTKITGVLNI